jgi:DNA (cytosine-5)-methyltransferase 1
MRTLPPTVATAVHVATLARKNGMPIPPKVLAVLDDAASPFPGRWLLDPLPGDPIRIIELFAGPGGWSEGIATVLGVAVDAVGIDVSKDACATARAAGHFRICADITTLDPEHYALRHTVGLIVSPPCPPFSPGGKHTGQEQANIDILCRVIAQCSEAAGLLPAQEVLDDFCEGCDECEEVGYHEGFMPRSGLTWDDLRAQLTPLSDPRIGLMAEGVIWALGLQAAGAPMEFFAMEQSSRLPVQILEDIKLELCGAADGGAIAWAHAKHAVLEASTFGLASRRERVFLVASAHGYAKLPTAAPETPITSMAQALGWGEGERINTRGVRPIDPATGRPKGGNEFSADKPSNCLTGKTRTWKRVSDGLRLTQNEAALLVGFRASYPSQGSRTSVFQQLADVVPPPIAARLLAQFFNVNGEALAADYLCQLYRMDELTGDTDEYDTAA